MSISVGDVLKVVTVLQWLDGDIMQNVWNAVITGSGGPYTDSNILSDAVIWMNAIHLNLGADLSDEVDGSEIVVYVYDPVDDDWDEVASQSWAYNFTDAAQQLPRGVALLINAKTTDPDVNGKKYIGGLTEDGATDGLWNAPLLTIAGDVADDWLTPFAGATSGADWQPGIWSPTNTNFYAATGTAIVPSIPAYQRRRKQGVGI